MSEALLGIDYGTSNTVAVLRLPGRPAQPLLYHGTPLLPSSVYAEPAGQLLAGREAGRSARLDPARYEPNPKRHIDDRQVLLGDGTYPVGDLIAATLRQVALEARRVAGVPLSSVTMTCPVAWGPARRSVLTSAAVAAGMPEPCLVSEPVAAATYFATTLGRRVVPGQSVVVYDLGGGTFDVCVVRATCTGFEPWPTAVWTTWAVSTSTSS